MDIPINLQQLTPLDRFRINTHYRQPLNVFRQTRESLERLCTAQTFLKHSLDACVYMLKQEIAEREMVKEVLANISL